MHGKKLWKVTCQDELFPGMWQRWFKNQCVAVGWPSEEGFPLHGKPSNGEGWIPARNALIKMNIGDFVIASLRGNRIGRIGEITSKTIDDNDWDPLVPRGANYPYGNMGRRILVRWDLNTGPSDPDLIVQMPPGKTLSNGELRPTIAMIRSRTMDEITKIMRDRSNWVSLLGKFRYEKALSDYIATYPHHLEDGLLPHPDTKIREMVFVDKTRLDVLLIDRNDTPTIVECKQNAPSIEDLQQLRHYMERLEDETNTKSRGILVHGGARKLTSDVIRDARRQPKIEIMTYKLSVEFNPIDLD